jgi:hypothetical protein
MPSIWIGPSQWSNLFELRKNSDTRWAFGKFDGGTWMIRSANVAYDT